MIVYHVDEGVTSTNDANADDTHRLLDVVEADGSKNMDTYPYLGWAADVFPGSSGHVDFNDATAPSAVLVLGQPVGHRHARQRRLRGPDDRELLRAAAERRVRLGHGPRRRRSARVTAGNNGATKEAGEPAVAGNGGGASVWWKFRAPATGKLRLSTAGSSFDTLLGVYRGSSVAASEGGRLQRQRVGHRPLQHRGGQGQARRDLPDRRRRREPARQGAVTLVATATRRSTTTSRRPPPSRARRARRPAPTSAPSKERKEPRKIAGKKSGKTVWYKYKAKQSGRLTIDLSGSRFNTLLGVYTGSKVKKLHKVAANDNGGKGKSSRVTFRIRKGQTYRIAVAGVKSADGNFRISWHL